MNEYARAVERNLDGLEYVSVGLAGICTTCQSAWGMTPRAFYSGVDSGDVFDEGGFSRQSCDTCGSTLGGNRYAAHARDAETNALLHLEVCTDCLMYLANGDESSA